MAGEAAALKLEETAESPPPVNDDMTITLTAPVMAHGERLKALTFRQPICSDIMQIDEGWPVRIDYVGQQVIPCPKPMGELLSILAAVPPSTVRALKGIDFTTCAQAVAVRHFPPRGNFITTNAGGDIVVELLTSIVGAKNETITKLILHEPTGADMMQLGEMWPVRIDYIEKIVFPVARPMAALLSTLSGHSLNTIKELKARDFATCAEAVTHFFVPGSQVMQL